MGIQQRPRLTKPSGPAQLWQPDEQWAAQGPEVRHPPSPSELDHYVTVDERVENTIGVVFSRWPHVDEYGLRFRSQPEAAWFDAGELQSTIDRFRDGSGETLRPLRIGDTFWVQGFSETSTSRWNDLRDVTSQAREMARAVSALAVLGAFRRYAFSSTFFEDDGPSDFTTGESAQPPGGAETARPTI